MKRALLAAALLCLSAQATACPICLGAGHETKAEQLVAARQAVLAVATTDADRFRVVAVVKGSRPAGATIEGGYPRFGPAFGAASHERGKPLLLVRDDPIPTWVILGSIDADRLDWLRMVATAKPVAETSAEAWRDRVARIVPFLEDRDPLVAEIAYGELAAAPYAAMRAAAARVDASAVRRWLADPSRSARRTLHLLLMGVAGNAQDAAVIDKRLDEAWRSGDATNLASLLAADLELRGAARMPWVEAKYLRDPARTVPEIKAALLALSMHGNASGRISRERVIQAYRVFMQEHKDIAGYVAQDLAAWQYWDAVPEYVALLKSDVRQQVPSQVAILAYLRQSPVVSARELRP